MQHWRAVIAFNNGHTVSSNVAPSTTTEGVVHNDNLLQLMMESIILKQWK